MTRISHITYLLSLTRKYVLSIVNLCVICYFHKEMYFREGFKTKKWSNLGKLMIGGI